MTEFVIVHWIYHSGLNCYSRLNMSFRADMLFWASIILRYVCHSGQTSSFWAELVILNKLNCHSVLDLSFWTTTFSPSDGTLLTDMRNRVEHQKRNQPAIEKWPFGFVFGVQLGLRQTRALILTRKNKLLQVEQLWHKWGAFTASSSHCSSLVP